MAKKIAELNNLKTECFTVLLNAQKDGDRSSANQISNLILKIIDTESKLFGLYDRDRNQNPNATIEELLIEYESRKQRTLSEPLQELLDSGQDELDKLLDDDNTDDEQIELPGD